MTYVALGRLRRPRARDPALGVALRALEGLPAPEQLACSRGSWSNTTLKA
jgi:hypothetical protein